MIPQNYTSRFDISDVEAERIGAAADSESEFVLVWESEDWWKEGAWERHTKREDCISMLVSALSLALCVPAGPQERTASNLAADIARIGLDQGLIDESHIESAKVLSVRMGAKLGAFS